MPKVVKGKLKVFICEICNREFTVPYVGENNKSVIVKTCGDCYSEVKKRSALTRVNGGVNLDELFESFKLTIVEIYNNTSVVPTKEQVIKKLSVSSKTVNKMFKGKDINYNTLCDNLGLKKTGRSKFQQNVLLCLHELYKGHAIVSEKHFDNLVNPRTNAYIYIDYFIHALNLAIECDGAQHSDKNHYYNSLASNNGWTSVMDTDKIKDDYCSSNNIKLIRIPYTRNVTLEYVSQYINI